MLTLTLEPEFEQRVAECARSRGMSEADFVLALIEEGLDDVRMAVERLENPLPPVTSAAAASVVMTGFEEEPRAPSGAARSFGELLAACALAADDLPPRRPARVIRRKTFD